MWSASTTSNQSAKRWRWWTPRAVSTSHRRNSCKLVRRWGTQMDMARQWFGTDGIRGVAGQYPMTPEMALLLGRALAELVQRGKIHGSGRRGHHRPRIVI